MNDLQRSVFICFLYGASSLTLSLLNKAVLSRFKFNLPFLLLAMQSCTAFLFVSLLKALRARGVGHGVIPEIKAFSPHTFRKSAPLGVVFIANVVAGFMGLEACSIPMFLVIRRTATLFVLVTQFVLQGAKPNSTTAFAVSLICSGALIAGWETLEMNIIGYLYVVANNFLTAVSLTLQKRFSTDTGAEGLAIVWYTALTAVPLALIASLHNGELATLLHYPFLTDTSFLVALGVSVSMGAFISFTIALCATVNSPLATTVTGNVKDIVATFLGWALFGGFQPTFAAITGLFVSFFGAGVYSVSKLRASTAAPVVVGDSADNKPKPAVVSNGETTRAAMERIRQRPAADAAV